MMSEILIEVVRTMRYLRILISTALLLIAPTFLPAQSAASAAESSAIRTVLDKQAADWNRGDIDSFATGYKNSPDILFMGPKISRGYAEMVATYKKHYSTRAKMGTLSFADLEVQPLDEHFATVTGKFHLDLSAEEGGNADGYYLLVMEKTPSGWKIIRDASTNLPKAAAK